MSVVGLGGGIGATRLWRALAPEVGPRSLTVVVNTADDLWHYGLRVCPDIDTVIYGLSERQDSSRGWGLHGDTFSAMSTLRALGEEVWFNVGDQDLATHLLRTEMLRSGASLTETTHQLSRVNGLEVSLLPMCDEEVSTEICGADGRWIPFQDFHVRHGAQPAVTGVRYRGVDQATTPGGVLEAIESAELIVLAPSNPLASLAPILEVDHTRAAIAASRAPVVAVSPIVSGRPITDPGDAHRARCRQRLMATQGMPHWATSAAALVADIADVFVLDEADRNEAESIRSLGLDVMVTSTLTHVHPGAAKELVTSIVSLMP